MDAQERRQAIARRLEEASGPVSAAVLAREHSVSRQIIVGDIALLRAGGMDIAATPRGYVLPAPAAGLVRTLACRHRADQMEEELNAMVDQGCTVLDVIVEHPIYGQLTGQLQISSRYDVGQFVQRCRRQEAAPLSQLTEGIHLHTVACPSQEAYDRVRESLSKLGFFAGGEVNPWGSPLSRGCAAPALPQGEPSRGGCPHPPDSQGPLGTAAPTVIARSEATRQSVPNVSLASPCGGGAQCAHWAERASPPK